MAMSEAEFARLVADAVKVAARSPRAYRLQIVGLVALGYLFLVGLVACVGAILALVVAAVWFGKAWALLALKNAIIPLVLLAWVLLRALWVSLPRPHGVPLTRADAPGLFACMDEVRRATRGPRVDHVIVDGDFNCGVVQRARLGVFGWVENWLIVGLPFALSVSPPMMKAVLAHEYGHLSGRHGHFGAWIYRMRRTWGVIAAAFAQTQGVGQRIVARFLAWYAPRFNAYTFALARQNEYEADRVAADVAGAQASAQALVYTAARGRALQRDFWPGYARLAIAHPAPPRLPFASLRTHADEAPALDLTHDDVTQAMAIKTGYADTHPSLSDRLAALGITFDVLTPVQESAADVMLTPALPRLIESLDKEWADTGGLRWWSEHHERSKANTERLAVLERERAARALDAREAYEYAALRAEIVPREDALPLFEEALAAGPDELGSMVSVAWRRLERDDASGLDLSERAWQKDSRAIEAIGRVVLAYAERHELDDLALVWRERWDVYLHGQARADRERTRVTTDDLVYAHSLTASELGRLAARARGCGARRAWVAQKVLNESRGDRFLIVVVRAGFLQKIDDRKLGEAVAGVFETPTLTAVVPDHRTWRRLAKRVKAQEGAELTL